MSDEFMLKAWRTPAPDFTRQLREHLRRLDAQHKPARRPRFALRVLAYAASVVLAVGLFAIPSVRAGAEAFLDLFRVVNFVAVPLEKKRLDVLQQGLDLPRLLGEQVQVVKAPGEPQAVATLDEAGALTGIHVRTPAWRPVGLELTQIAVLGEQTYTLTASAAQIQHVLDALGIDDLSVPPGIDGKTATIHVPPAVHVVYSNKAVHAMLLEARRPDATLPPGTDLAQLAEIGLRVLGVDSSEAHRLAQSVDWRTTLLVPVPSSVGRFHQVNVQGGSGLLIESPPASIDAPWIRSQLMWSSGDAVFTLVGNVRPEELYEMAQSMQ